VQGLLPSELALDIYAVDPSYEAIQKTQILVQNTPAKHAETNLITSQEVPKGIQFDVVIIATSSFVRLEALQNVLEYNQVSCVVLEKFLFANETEYEQAQILLHKHRVPAYVNCPRRMNPSYQLLKQRLSQSSNLAMKVTGTAWGLACNAIHMVDLFHFLSATHHDLNFMSSGLCDGIYDSKRDGYKEVFGTLSDMDQRLVLECQRGEDFSLVIKIELDDGYITIDELNQVMKVTTQKISKEESFLQVYQSALSFKFVEQFITQGDMPLTPFEQSVQYHMSLFFAFTEHFKKFNLECEHDCPIT
jgi:hypothetical protein